MSCSGPKSNLEKSIQDWITQNEYDPSSIAELSVQYRFVDSLYRFDRDYYLNKTLAEQWVSLGVAQMFKSRDDLMGMILLSQIMPGKIQYSAKIDSYNKKAGNIMSKSTKGAVIYVSYNATDKSGQYRGLKTLYFTSSAQDSLELVGWDKQKTIALNAQNPCFFLDKDVQKKHRELNPESVIQNMINAFQLFNADNSIIELFENLKEKARIDHKYYEAMVTAYNDARQDAIPLKLGSTGKKLKIKSDGAYNRKIHFTRERTGGTNLDANTWNEYLDEYESFVEDYIDLLEDATNGDLDALTESMKMLERAQSLERKLENAKGSLSSSQLSRFMHIQQKIINKLN